MHALIHTDTTRVIGGSLLAFAASYTNLMESLRATLLVLSIIYTLLKIWKALKPKAPVNDTDPPIKP